MRNFLILAILFLTHNTERLFACSCIKRQTVEEAVKNADAIVVGTILSKEVITFPNSTFLEMFPNDTNSKFSKMRVARYNLLMQDIYKGKISNDTIAIYTGLGGGDCGFEFEVGSRYIIYGAEEAIRFPLAKNALYTTICMRTRAFFQNEIDEIEKYAKKKKHDGNE